ncbi:ABC transporter ATP-binding protein [Halobacteriales archaeon SW_7_65_23]|nr:MAG: ABC transporter ATP-binding protein [Halobacteriales archaeon SW_7_65_23]
MSFLELEDVQTYYGQSHVLQGVDLEVDEGEVVALLGRNGVGKTTTIRSILQLTPPRSGDVRFRGESLVGKDTHEVAGAGIGWIPEGRRMFARLSVEENLRAAVPDATAVDEALGTAYDTFPILQERRGQRAGTLSGGQQQMLAIARGLIGDNDLLLIDEPSEGLAPQIVSDVGRALLSASEEVSILLVEQKLSLALDLANRFYVMDHGTIIDSGETADVTAEDERLRRHLSA